jgi:hypothetical protein
MAMSMHVLSYVAISAAAAAVGWGLFDVGRWWRAQGREQWKREMKKHG